MAEISKITLPSGNTYDLKDAVAREMIAGGITFIVAWNGASTPVAANIPAGVVVTYNDTTYTGTLAASAAQAGAFYLVKSSTQKGGTLDVYDEYAVITVGSSKSWEKLGDTQLDLSDLGALAYKDNVVLSKGSGDNVLGESTTFTAGSSSVTFTGGSTDTVLGSDATFTTTVTPTTTNIKATASGTAVGANGTAAAITGFGAHTTDKVLGSDATFTTTVTPSVKWITIDRSTNAAVGASGSDTFVKSYPGTTQKLATTTVPNVTGNTDVSIPNVTSAGSASTWSFAMGTGTDAETLIISGANGAAPTLGTNLSASKVTLGTAKTVATGSLSASGSGGTVMTGLGTPTTASAVTGVAVTQQPEFSLHDDDLEPEDGIVTVDITEGGHISATTTVNSKDEVTAITALGTPTTSNCLTGVKVTTQPTIALATGATAGTGVISVATGISSATTTTNNKDQVTAVTSVGTGTAAAQTITVGTNDKVKVAKYDDLSVSVS